MDKQKFDPDWMEEPKMLKEVIREQMIEYGQVIKGRGDKRKATLKAVTGVDFN